VVTSWLPESDVGGADALTVRSTAAVSRLADPGAALAVTTADGDDRSDAGGQTIFELIGVGLGFSTIARGAGLSSTKALGGTSDTARVSFATAALRRTGGATA